MTIPRAIPDIAALPRPVFARAESLSAGSWTHPHSHAWVQFSYAVRGVLEVRTRQGSHMAPPQRAIWIPAGLPHEVMTSGPAEQRSLYIDPVALAPLWGTAPDHCRVVEVTPLARELLLAFTRLRADYDERGAHGRLVGCCWTNWWPCRRPGCPCRCLSMRGWQPCARPCWTPPARTTPCRVWLRGQA